MITLEKAIQKSMTRPRFSVHHTSFLWALCQELVLSTTHRKRASSGADLPFSEIAPIATIKTLTQMRSWMKAYSTDLCMRIA
jgi:hypothetical protein